MSIDTTDNTVNSGVASSASYFSFRPTNQVLDAFLPSVSTPGVYHVDVDNVEANEVVFIDPEVAVGYDFAIGTVDPSFANVILPDLGDGLYDVFSFDAMGEQVLLQANVTAGQQFAFGGAGVNRFRVLGIEESVMLDPVDPLAFRAGISPVARGSFTGTMTAITRNVSATLALLAIGLLGGLLRRRAST